MVSFLLLTGTFYSGVEEVAKVISEEFGYQIVRLPQPLFFFENNDGDVSRSVKI